MKTRKFLSLFLALITVISAIPMTEIAVFAESSGDFAYSVTSEEKKTCMITDYVGSATELAIPSEFGGYTVTSIGDSAFLLCKSLTSITVPNTVTSINSSAFKSCTSLRSITIPDSVTSIGDDAFLNCTSLEGITIPNSVTSIGTDAFTFCSSLESITIPNSVTSIGSSAFAYCTSLTSVKIPDNAKSIGDFAFAYCSSLTSIKIPDSVTAIGDWAFDKCEKLKICGNSGSYAQTYANENSISFYTLGDVNFDGTVNSNDYAIIRSYIMCRGTLSEEQRIAADYDYDGTVDAFDAISLDIYLN